MLDPAGNDSALHLPVSLLGRYLFFLARRPISSSNSHFLVRRLAGLRSLAPLIGEPEARAGGLGAVAEMLTRLSPANFVRLGPEIQNALVAMRPPELPAGYVASRKPPPPGFVAGSRRILVILGPGIGIGDEIICFSLPGWLRQASAEAEITLLSAYPTLWDGVPEIDSASYYRDYADLVEAIRRPAGGAAFDLVLMVDFEKPALLGAMSNEPTVERYAELSLGSRSLWALDKPNGWLHEHRPPEQRFSNFYALLHHLGEWLLGGSRRLERRYARAGHRPRAASGGLTVFVSPFTSKYEPQASRWSSLLAGIVPSRADKAFRFVFDPGPNRSTESFAVELMRSTRGRAPAAAGFALAGSPGERTLSLSGLFHELERTDVVICADSFAAHAGPACGCTTLVMAATGLADWRVPRAQSYYLDDSAPIPRLAAAMRAVLDQLADGSAAPRALGTGAGARRLLDASAALAEAFAGDVGEANAALAPYDRLYRAYRSLLVTLPGNSPGLEALLGDQYYDDLLPSLPPASLLEDGGRLEDLRQHLEDRFETWRTSNLYKYLRLASAADCGGDR